jgi:hypothetical protein
VEDDDFISIAEARHVLGRALPAIVSGDIGAIELFTEDVAGDSPDMRVRSRTELGNQLIDRAETLSNVEFRLDRVEADHPGVRATWHMAGDHTGEVLFNEDQLFEPSGRRIVLTATTHARFRSGRSCEFLTTSEDADLIDQIRAGRPPADP